MNFVLIYGPPGAGKLTVATELVRLTGYKLFDNHMSIDWARNFFDFSPGPFWDLVHGFRRVVMEVAAREDMDLIFTFVFALGEDEAYVEERCRIVEGQGGRVCPVQLTCDQASLLSRVGSNDRVLRQKLTSAPTLKEMFEQHELFKPIPGRASLCIDNTNLSPTEVASQIVEHFQLRRG